MLGALVAVGGVSFAVGRWTAEDQSSSLTASFPRLASAAAGAQTTARDGATQAPELGSDSTATGRTATELTQGSDGADLSGGLAVAGPGGFGMGTEGTVVAIDESTLTLEDAQGVSSEFAIGADTTFLSQAVVEPTAIEAGELVRVQFPIPGLTAADSAQEDPPAESASQVTVLASGSRSGEQAAAGQVPPDAARPGTGQAFAARGGRGPIAVEGTLVAVADGGIMITGADGETQLVATGADTRFVRQQAVEPATIQIGDLVRVQVSRGSFGQAGGSSEASAPRAASTITLIAPVGT